MVERGMDVIDKPLLKLYVIRNDRNDRVRTGCTRSVAVRVAQINAHDDGHWHLIAAIVVPNTLPARVLLRTWRDAVGTNATLAAVLREGRDMAQALGLRVYDFTSHNNVVTAAVDCVATTREWRGLSLTPPAPRRKRRKTHAVLAAIFNG